MKRKYVVWIAVALMVLSVVLLWLLVTRAQQKAVTLSPEASQRFLEQENQKARLREAYGEILKQQDALLLGAGMAPETREAAKAWNGQGAPPWTIKDGVVSFPKPEAKPSP